MDSRNSRLDGMRGVSLWINPDKVLGLVDSHLARRSLMEPSDVYKLLYQGVLGPEHSITSPKTFLAHLRAEWQALELKCEEPLVESIHPTGDLVRLNLRPYVKLSGSMDLLVAACLETSHRTWGTIIELKTAWEIFFQACQHQRWPLLNQAETNHFTSWLQEEGYPAVHHSQTYRQNYQPAYRLCANEYLPALDIT